MYPAPSHTTKTDRQEGRDKPPPLNMILYQLRSCGHGSVVHLAQYAGSDWRNNNNTKKPWDACVQDGNVISSAWCFLLIQRLFTYGFSFSFPNVYARWVGQVTKCYYHCFTDEDATTRIQWNTGALFPLKVSKEHKCFFPSLSCFLTSWSPLPTN